MNGYHYLRCVKNIITTTSTNRINVANTPIVAIVPRFIRPSSPNVTQPMIQRDSLISELHDITSSNYILWFIQFYNIIHTYLQYFQIFWDWLPEDRTHNWKKLVAIFQTLCILLQFLLDFLKKNGKQLSMNSCILWNRT